MYKYGDDTAAERYATGSLQREDFESLLATEPFDGGGVDGYVDDVLEAMHRPAIDAELARMGAWPAHAREQVVCVDDSPRVYAESLAELACAFDWRKL